MRLYTKQQYANRELHLPLVGITKLDGEASFECDDKIAEGVINATKGSLEFHSNAKKANEKPLKEAITSSERTKIQVEKLKEAANLLAFFRGSTLGIDEVISQLSGNKYVTPQEELKDTESGKEKPEPIVVHDQGKQLNKAENPPKLDEVGKDEGVKEEGKEEEPVVNPEDIKEAIDSCDSVDELKSLLELIPGVKAKDTKNLDVEQLKAFLKKKVDEKSKK